MRRDRRRRTRGWRGHVGGREHARRRRRRIGHAVGPAAIPIAPLVPARGVGTPTLRFYLDNTAHLGAPSCVQCPASAIGFGIVTDGLDRSEPARETIDASVVVEILEQQRVEGRHQCAQCYVSVGGEPVLDVAIGESIPGRALRTDDLMLWYSSGKPLTTTAVLQLWERGQLGLDDLVADYIDGWGNGKERCTLRHVLTHTGGFPMFRDTVVRRRHLVRSDDPAHRRPSRPTGYRGRRRRTTRSRAGRSWGRSSRPSTADRSTGTSARRSSTRSA